MRKLAIIAALVVLAIAGPAEAKPTNPSMAPTPVAGGVFVDIGCSTPYTSPWTPLGPTWTEPAARGEWRVFSYQAQPGHLTIMVGRTTVYDGPIWTYGFSGSYFGLQQYGTIAENQTLTVTIDGTRYRYRGRRCP